MTKKEQACQLLRQGIMDGTFPPDSFLQEIQLSERFGMSRTPIREALLILEKEGLVTNVPNKGARVSVLSSSDVRQLSEAREAIEAMAVYLAVGRIDRERLREVRAMLESEMEECKTSREKLVSEERFKLSDSIHSIILEAAGNKYLKTIYATLATPFARMITLSRTVGRYEKALREHLEIIIALQDEDTERAVQAMRNHIRRMTRDVLNANLL